MRMERGGKKPMLLAGKPQLATEEQGEAFTKNAWIENWRFATVNRSQGPGIGIRCRDSTDEGATAIRAVRRTQMTSGAAA